MTSRALASVALHSDDYELVYGRVLGQVREPVILHWLGPMFDPALGGYWGAFDVSAATGNCLGIIRANREKIDGIKISLLDANLEVSMRRQLPDSVRMYTGDDFNYDRLIAGDEQGHSDALLGIFDAIAPVASIALAALDAGDVLRYQELLAPTVPLSRHIFASPTQHYKTGVVFLAFLNGFQSHFREPCGSGTEIHSGTPGTRRLSYSAGSVTQRCVVKAVRWVRATPDSEEYLPRRVQSAPRMLLERWHR